MRRIFSSPVVALIAGFCLRLFFVLKFPSTSGDTVLYEQIASNWIKYGSYAMDVAGKITPVDIRVPGYPAFLAIIYALSRHDGESARFWVMLAQVGLDLVTCFVAASLAALLISDISDHANRKRVFLAALWLAALCPFTANYTAVPLTEIFAIFWTALACRILAVALWRVQKPDFLMKGTHLRLSQSVEYTALGAGWIVGVGTLFRPETPILLVAAAIVFGSLFFLRRNYLRWLWVCLAMALGCLMVLSPWAIRNIVTLGEPQFLAPKDSNLPGELVPYGFMSWEKTWLFRVSDCYFVTWKLNDEPINLDEIPARAFDTPEEKQRVATILEQYNEEITLSQEGDAAFAQLALERTARHPLRTYLWLPAARALTLWFSPRIERLPFSGHVFPLAQTWVDDPVDQSVTVLLFVLNTVYVVLALWGSFRLWRCAPDSRPIILFFAAFLLLRTAFLTTVEAPEPRYMLVCFPILIVLAAQLFARSRINP